MVAFVSLFQLKILFTKNGSAYSSKSKFFCKQLNGMAFSLLLSLAWNDLSQFVSVYVSLSNYYFYSSFLLLSMYFSSLFIFPSSITLTRYLKSSTILVAFHQVLANRVLPQVSSTRQAFELWYLKQAELKPNYLKFELELLEAWVIR